MGGSVGRVVRRRGYRRQWDADEKLAGCFLVFWGFSVLLFLAFSVALLVLVIKLIGTV